MDDEDVKVLTIGVGGEKLVRYANVMTGIKNSGGRTGMGAVMGSKNLKAIAARGSLPIPLANPEGTLAYHKEMIDYIQGSKFAEIMGTWGTLYIYDVTNSTGLVRTRNFQSNQSQYSEDLEAEAIEPYSVGTAACYGCTMHCRHKYKIKDGPYKGVYDEGPEYTTQGAFGTEVGCTSMHTLLVGNHLVNRLGIDTLEVGSMIGWAMELYEKGLLPKELVGDLDLTWGNDDAVIQLTKDIAYRRGLGDILAEGPIRAAEKLGPETLKYNIQIKGMSNLQSDERATPSLALNIATSTRGSDHLRSRPAIDLYHLPEPVLAKIYGKSGLSSDYRDYDGKAWQVYWQACLYAVVDALGICKFQTVFMSPNSPTWVEYSKMIELATGMKITPEQVMEIGDRIYTTERMFNLREGATRADDWLPERYFDEPVPAGLDAVRGLCIDRDKFTKMIDEYYEHHGWDNEGVPTPETLTRLNLDRQPEHVL
jgi:aldehyde:ferredoxin oxidoreductase